MLGPLRALLALMLLSSALGYSIKQIRSSRLGVPTPWTTRRNALTAVVSLALPSIALASNGTATEEPDFDYAAYFGPFSCEWWGLERSSGSNQCKDKIK
jgi:hypothetical protein